MALSKLQAVNLIRGSVGKAPVSTLNTTNPDVIACTNRLEQVTSELQVTSWWFNSDYGINLTPDIDGALLVPSNALEVRPESPFEYVVVRGNRMYDPRNNTYVFESALKVDMLIELPFDDLPFVARNRIQYDAARKFQADFDGDPNRIADLRNDAEQARMLLNVSELRNRRVNVLHSFGPQRLFSGIRPQGSSSYNPLFPGGIRNG